MLRFLVSLREQVLTGKGGLGEGKQAQGTGYVGVETREASGQWGVGVAKKVLAACMNVFGTGPILEMSHN